MSDEQTVCPVRRQFDFNEQTMKRLDALKTATESASDAETVRNAIKWYAWMVGQTAAGRTIIVEYPDGAQHRQEMP